MAIALPAIVVATAVCAQSDQRSLVTAATLTFANFKNDPDMEWLQRNLARAKAVMIAPEITKAGFILGGSGGRAVVGAGARLIDVYIHRMLGETGGFDTNGAPIGLQLIGRSFDESTLLTIGAAFQRATDFHDRVPALP